MIRKVVKLLEVNVKGRFVFRKEDIPLMNKLSKVAIVGAGASGLCTASRFQQLGLTKMKIFESATQLGGTWRYVDNPSDDPCSSMYSNLLTNLPTKVMNFPDFPFPEDTDAFPRHEVILEYLKSYAARANLEKYIEYESHVRNVQFVEETKRWSVNDEMFDFLVIANGHYAIPSCPKIFINSSFTGEIVHTHYYRKPEAVKGKRVLVIGHGPSGLDIALDILGIAESVVLLGRGDVKGMPFE